MAPFDEATALEVLRCVRLGATLREATSSDDELLAVYDWLKDGSCKIEKKTFAAMYREAQTDQKRSWLDIAKEMMDDFEPSGDRAKDTVRLKKVHDMARLLVSLGREQTQTNKIAVGTAGEDIQVTITRFGAPEQPDEPSLDQAGDKILEHLDDDC